jgi:hypothetical protein
MVFRCTGNYYERKGFLTIKFHIERAFVVCWFLAKKGPSHKSDGLLLNYMHDPFEALSLLGQG